MTQISCNEWLKQSNSFKYTNKVTFAWWWWEFLNDIHLCFFHFNALGRYFVAQDNPFSHHEMEFLLIENEIGFNTSLEYNF